jgi:Rps23 Pro-64 3,4-dihydroxylase Tpa1-like proline 4-hydroxylase
MLLQAFVGERWLDPEGLKEQYTGAAPFPHIVMENFLRPEVLDKVAAEFPDLKARKEESIQYDNNREIKFASRGMGQLSSAAFELVSCLNSDIFLRYLQTLTSVEEPLISDPYLSGGGYHEIKQGGLLKIHADFNKHPHFNLDRRLNLLIYLNKDWSDDWGGALELFHMDMSGPVVKVAPRFNTAVVFTTTSFAYHGHPDPLTCPEDRSRRSLALYYFSTGRPADDVSPTKHSTLFKEREGEQFEKPNVIKNIAREICPPVLWKALSRAVNR